MNSTLTTLIDRWTEAERSGDAATLDALLAEDFVGIGPVGFVLDRDTWLGRFDHDLGYDELALDELSSHPHGDATIVVARQRAIGTAHGTPTPPDTRVTFTIVGEDDALRIAGMQYSFNGPPLGAAR